MLETPNETEILPKGPEDEIIPTRVAELNEHIAFLKQNMDVLAGAIRDAEIDKSELIKRANSLNITADANYKIVKTPLYPAKRVDVERLKAVLPPDRYELIIQNIHATLQDKIEAEKLKAESFISQSDVKAVVTDKATLAMVIPEQTTIIGWNVTVVKR